VYFRENKFRFLMPNCLKESSSTSIRRSFRNWLSEKLLLEDGDIKKFIEEVIDSKEIELFWKDDDIFSRNSLSIIFSNAHSS
jgi:hypothetical protein